MFNREEITNLKQLLSSGDENNQILALEILSNHVELIKEFAEPILLFIKFGSLEDSDTEKQLKNRYKKLWKDNIRVSEQLNFENEIEILDRAHKENWWDWFKAMDEIKNFEIKEHLYEPYILNNKFYLRIYHNIVSRAILENDIHLAYRFYKKIISASLSTVNDRVRFADFLLNECFYRNLLIEEELSNAEKYLKEGIDAYPALKASYMHNLGTLADVYRKDKALAKHYYREVLAIKPDSAITLNNLANILFKTEGNKEESRRMATLAVKINSKSVDYLDTLAWIEFKGFENLVGAEELFWDIRKIDQNEEHDASLTALGEILELKGDLEDAKMYYSKGLKLEPFNKYKILKMANLLFKMGNLEELKSFCKKLNIDPENLEA